MRPLDLAAWCAALFLAANLFPHTVALRLTLLVLGLAFVGVALVRARRPLDLKLIPPLLIPILLWAAWAALSITWSVEPARSMKEYKNEVVYAFLAYWLCWLAVQTPDARRAFCLRLARRPSGVGAGCGRRGFVRLRRAVSRRVGRLGRGRARRAGRSVRAAAAVRRLPAVGRQEGG